jgi:apolipoprotein N-acyltransferase
MSVRMFRTQLVFGLLFVGLGVSWLHLDLVNGLLWVALGVAYFVSALLGRKGILPERPGKPPMQNPYQENLPTR